MSLPTLWPMKLWHSRIDAALGVTGEGRVFRPPRYLAVLGHNFHCCMLLTIFVSGLSTISCTCLRFVHAWSPSDHTIMRHGTPLLLINQCLWWYSSSPRGFTRVDVLNFLRVTLVYMSWWPKHSSMSWMSWIPGVHSSHGFSFCFSGLPLKHVRG